MKYIGHIISRNLTHPERVASFEIWHSIYFVNLVILNLYVLFFIKSYF